MGGNGCGVFATKSQLPSAANTKGVTMRKELDYFQVDGALGWNQSWFLDWAMADGGCAAVTACDLCIVLAKQKGFSMLYPYDAGNVTKAQYLSFSEIMKPYLRPRWQGIDTLALYLSGMRSYWRDCRAGFLQAEGLPGDAPRAQAMELIRRQIDGGWLIPFLLLYHQSRALADFQWHWFNLAGYQEFCGSFYVKAVTYGSFRWLDFRELWETGYQNKGGIIRIFA